MVSGKEMVTMGSGRNLPLYAYPSDKKRLEDMRRGMEVAQERRIVMADVIRALLAEHDRALEGETA